MRELIDARLLTSYEVKEEDRDPTRRVEIIHESLLANWPRLVRWQTQDADAVQLRDQLRQAARTWEEHDRSDDMLWTGSAYREFALWWERYPGGLSEIEEAFARAMALFATRRRRRRRVAAAIVVVFLSLVATVLGTLWRRSVREANRAEASKLVALAQIQFEADPTEALAFATASLEVADSFAARSMVMRSLWEAPPALVLELADHQSVRFSPEGRWVAFGGATTVVEVWPESGDGPIVLRGLDSTVPSLRISRWSSESLLLTGPSAAERLRLWSIPDGRLIRTLELGAPSYWRVERDRLFSETFPSGSEGEGDALLRSWRLPDGEAEELGRVEWDELNTWNTFFEPSGAFWFYTKGSSIYARPLPAVDGARDRVVGSHDAGKVWLVSEFLKSGRLLSGDSEGGLREWLPAAPGVWAGRVIPAPETATAPYNPLPDPSGRWVHRQNASAIGKGLLWDLSALPGAEPLELRRSGSWQFSVSDFHPAGDWLAITTSAGEQVCFWPLRTAYPSVVKGVRSRRKGLAFSPDGRWLATRWPSRRARLFPLPHTDRADPPELAEHSLFSNPVFNATGTHLTGGEFGDRLSVVPLDGGEPSRLEGFDKDTLIESAAFSPSGRLVAAASGIGTGEKMLRVWDLDTGEVRAFELPRTDTSSITRRYKGYLDNVQNLWFTGEDTLVTIGATHFLRWNLEDGSHEEILDLGVVMQRMAAASADVLKVILFEGDPGEEGGVICGTPELCDLATGTVEALPSFGDCVRAIALDPGGTVAVTGDNDGIIRVGRIAGGEPHLLVGHEGAIECVAISPDLRWVASVGSDSTLRLWPMPDLSQRPLHTLPHDKLLAKLDTLTNLRVVRDEESSTGWKIEVGPFPGWAEVPEW